LGGIIAGGLAYRAYEFSGLASAIAVVLIAGWIFVNLMTADGIFNALGNLLDPFHTAVNFFASRISLCVDSGQSFLAFSWFGCSCIFAWSHLVYVDIQVLEYWRLNPQPFNPFRQSQDMFDKIKESVQKFSSKSVADKEAVENLVKDIQRDLIRADVDVSLVSELSDEIREEALEDELPSGLTRKEHVLEIVYNKLEELLGEEAEIEIEAQKILLCGLYGAGKTTTAGKLADFYRKRGLKPGVIAADTDRPAAYDQLKQLAEDIDVSFYGEKEPKIQ